MSKKLIVEINVNSEWESGYALTRTNLDKVYKYIDLLQMEETDEVDMSSITHAIEDEYEKAGME